MIYASAFIDSITILSLKEIFRFHHPIKSISQTDEFTKFDSELVLRMKWISSQHAAATLEIPCTTTTTTTDEVLRARVDKGIPHLAYIRFGSYHGHCMMRDMVLIISFAQWWRA